MIAHLINTDIGNRGVTNLYLQYRKKNFNFLHNAAKMLLKNHENVLIVTGFPIPPKQQPETDGPSGALALYRAVEKMGGKAEIMTYPEIKKSLELFNVRFVDDPNLSEYSLIISIETPGRAENGKYYSMSGLEITRNPLDWAVVEATKLGIPTIGIGDGGNEIGMGNINSIVKKYVPLGDKIASIIKTDELILSAVSNWGAYGLVAQASIERGENFFEDWNEREVIKRLADTGLIDGVSKKIAMSVDGISVKVHEKMVQLLKGIINEKLQVVG